MQLPLGYLGLSHGQSAERAMQALGEVGMTHRADAFPAQLSGGEKQRVAIARALAKEPQLLFADEPTSALDASNGKKVIDLLHEIAHVHGTAVLCVSHDPRLVYHADRVLTMENGQIRGDMAASPSTEYMAFACLYFAADYVARSGTTSSDLYGGHRADAGRYEWH